MSSSMLCLYEHQRPGDSQPARLVSVLMSVPLMSPCVSVCVKYTAVCSLGDKVNVMFCFFVIVIMKANEIIDSCDI